LKEMAGAILLSIHNIMVLLEEARQCRAHILDGTFRDYYEDRAARLQQLPSASTKAP
jgi:tRNA-guanine family transglycosylase